MTTYTREVKTTTTSGGYGPKHTTVEEREFNSAGSGKTGNPFAQGISNNPNSTYRYYEAPLTYHRITVDPYDKLFEPVIFDYPSFSPDADAKALRKAMKGMGTDEKVIIDILTRRTNRQRQVIAEHYKKIHDRDLIKDLKSELSGTLEDVILGLMLTPEVYDARTLHKAVAGLGTDEQTLIEVIGSRTPEELAAIKRAYKAEFKNDLEKDIHGDTSGFFRQLLLAKLRASDGFAQRGRSYEISPKQAYHEAQALWETGPKTWSANEPFYIPIFTQRSEEHLRQVFDDYKQIGRIDIEKDIEKELKGDAKDLLLAFVRVSKNRPGYFADRLHSHLDGKTASRIIVSRAEKDLGSIKKEYMKRHGKTLEAAISNGFKGDDKNVLLGVLTSRSAAI